MLNIGLLAPGAGEYYIGEVASSAEDYYTGRGETAGRWVGSLAYEIGLHGEVDPDDFRAVLAGCDPQSGDQLVQRGTTQRVEGDCRGWEGQLSWLAEAGSAAGSAVTPSVRRLEPLARQASRSALGCQSTDVQGG